MNQENQAHPATSPIADSDTGEYNDIRRIYNRLLLNILYVINQKYGLNL